MVRTLVFGMASLLLCAAAVQAIAAEKPAKKDPVEEVFTLPKTAKLTPEQQEQFDKLRSEKEPDLKAAWEESQAAKDSKAKTAALKKFGDLKKEAKSAIAKILGAKSGGTKPPREKPPKREPIVKPKKDKPTRPGTLTPR